MFGTSKKVILVETDQHYEDGDTPAVHTTICDSLTDLLKRVVSELHYDCTAMDFLLNDKNFLKALDDRGFRDVAKITDAVEKVKAGTRFYTYDSGGFASLREFDIFTKDRYAAEHLASEKVLILQNVEKSSLSTINGTAYRSMLNARKRIEAAAKARTAKAANRQKNMKQNEIEKAKQLLAEAGILNELVEKKEKAKNERASGKT